MLRVGLTGGIGSGKSAVSALLRDRGAVVIDADKLAREVVEPGTPAIAAITERFGPNVIDADGALIRPALGAIVFADESARRELEAITHPAVRRLTADAESRAGADAIVVHDNPLLVEMGHHVDCDVVIVVDIPEEVQVARLVTERGMPENEARARIAAQMSRDARTDAADIVVDNTGSLDELSQKVGGIWDELLALATRGDGEPQRR